MSEQIRKRGRTSVLDQFRNEIGILSHEEIAKKAGCSPANVYMYGRRHGLLKSEQVVKERESVRRTSVLDDVAWMVGRFTDAFVARAVGCTAANVSIYRKKYGIPCASPEVLAATKAAVQGIALAA